MTHFFEKRDPWGHGMALWVLVFMIFVAPLAWWSVKQIELHNDVGNWLPADDPQSQTLRWFQNHFDHQDRVLLSWDGSSLNDPRVALLAEKLEGKPDQDGVRRSGLKQIDSVVTPQEVIARMVDYNIDRDEAVKRLEGVLIGRGKLKIRLTEAGRRSKKTTIKKLVTRAQTELGVDLSISDPLPMEFIETGDDEIADDEIADDEKSADDEEDAGESIYAAFPPAAEHDLQVSWREMQLDAERLDQFETLALNLRGRPTQQSDGEKLIAECFFAPGSPIALSVVLSEAGVAEKSDTFKEIRRVAAEVGIPAGELHLGGRHVAGNELNQEVKRAAWNPKAAVPYKRSVILLSGLISIVLAFVMLKSFRLATLVLFVTYYTTLIAIAVVPLTGGSMNMVLVVMPTLLMVLTMSAGIHLANYWKHAAHQNLATAVVEATKMARVPCTLAAVTTAIGLISLSTSPLMPVRDFGLYSAIGCLIALAVVLFGLPALLQFWPGKAPQAAEVNHEGWKGLGTLLSRYHKSVVFGCIVLFAGCSFGLKWFRTETKVIRYFPDDAKVVQDYHFLEENLAGIIPVDLVVRFDEEAQESLNFLQRMELVRKIQNKMRDHRDISGTLSLTNFQPVREKPPENANLFIRARYNKTAKTVEDRVRNENAGDAKSFLTLADESADLETPNGHHFSVKKGDELWRITAQVAIMSDLNYADLVGDEPQGKVGDLNAIAQAELKFHPGASHVVTGMIPFFLRTQQAVLESLIKSFGLAFVVIAIVMMIVLKNPLAGLLIMLPNLLPVGLVFGLISWNGLSVDIGTMITASVALGIAVDGTLHLLTWFKNGISQGMSRTEAVSHALGHCGPAMFQTSAAVGIGLLMLYPAELLLISRFGWLMSALIGAALVADVIFLPALLAGPLGHLIQKDLLYAKSKSETVTIETPKPQMADMAAKASRSVRIDSTGSTQ